MGGPRIIDPAKVIPEIIPWYIPGEHYITYKLRKNKFNFERVSRNKKIIQESNLLDILNLKKYLIKYLNLGYISDPSYKILRLRGKNLFNYYFFNDLNFTYVNNRSFISYLFNSFIDLNRFFPKPRNNKPV